MFATADKKITLDGLLVSEAHGVTIFTFGDSPTCVVGSSLRAKYKDQLDKVYVALETALSRHSDPRQARRLGIEPHTIAVFPTLESVDTQKEATFSGLMTL
jgi:hypothetical protein